MVNESPDRGAMGWSPALWSVLFYLSAIFAFCAVSPRGNDPQSSNRWRIASRLLRISGFAMLAFLAFSFRGANDQRIITLVPFSIHTEWYGILGLIGWAYLVGSMVFLLFRYNRTALLGSTVLLLCLYVADRNGLFHNFPLAKYVGIGGTLGSQGSITVAGLLLATILHTPETNALSKKVRFTLLFVTGCAAGALLVHPLYGIYKNAATPSWCLWASAITAALWLIFYFLCDIHPIRGIAKPLSLAGTNVLLPYLLSEMLPSALDLVGLAHWYGGLADSSLPGAIARSTSCSILILCASTTLNRLGVRLKL